MSGQIIRLLPWGPAQTDSVAAPWGLDWSRDLAHGKVITDPVQGDIHLNKLEVRLINSRAGQRLRLVRQLGTTHLVYPGATHTRFTHVLGAVTEAHRFVDALVNNTIRWEAEDADKFPHLLTGQERDTLATWVAEACVLARLGALLHDLCHIPFGHTLEDDLGFLEPHDQGQERFDALIMELGDDWQRFQESTSQFKRVNRLPTLADELRRLILSKADDNKDTPKRIWSNYPFVEDIVGNTICADLLDYLRRDHLNTGLPLELGRRFLDGFYVSPSRKPPALTGHPERMVCRIVRDGRERTDVTTELLKHLRYRYELTERVLAHHAKLSADATVGHIFDYWHASLVLERASESDSFDLGARPADTQTLPVRDLLKAAQSDPDEDCSAEIDSLHCYAEHAIEEAVRWKSDEALLGDLAAIHDSTGDQTVLETATRRLNGLARRVVDRQLPKLIGTSHAVGPSARRRAFEVFGSGAGTHARRQLEARVASVLGLAGLPILLWVPSPKMSLKPAKVLVDNGRRVEPLVDESSTAKDIETLHQGLWRVSVFAWPEIVDTDLKRDIALSIVADALQIQMVGSTGVPVASLDDLVVSRVARTTQCKAARLRSLEPVKGFTEGETFASRCDKLLAEAHAMKFTKRDKPPARGWLAE